MEKQWDVVIIGAGMAGVTAFNTVMEAKPETRVLLVNGEDRIPYKRTKLSKFIAPGFSRDQFALHTSTHYQTGASRILTETRVEAVDPSAHTIGLSNGQEVHYGSLVLCPGATPVSFPEWTDNVLYLRSAIDAERIRAAAEGKKTSVVIGSGILGVEIAFQLHLLGLSVTIVGSHGQPMTRQLDSEASAILTNAMTHRGVAIVNNCRVTQVTQSSDGTFEVGGKGLQLRADLVIGCVGTNPDLRLAERCGLHVANGILVDDNMLTSAEAIYAAGDAVELRNQEVLHLWHQAEATGTYAGLNAVGMHEPYRHTVFRTKCEVFDRFFFSAGVLPNTNSGTYTLTRRNPYANFVVNDKRLVGVVMMDDPGQGKLYERAVREGWGEDQVSTRFLRI